MEVVAIIFIVLLPAYLGAMAFDIPALGWVFGMIAPAAILVFVTEMVNGFAGIISFLFVLFWMVYKILKKKSVNISGSSGEYGRGDFGGDGGGG